MKVRQMVKVEGLRRRLGREKFYPHPPAILTPGLSAYATSGEGGKREFRQVVPRRDILFIPKGSRLCFEMVQASLATEDRFERARQESNERIRNSMYNLRREGVGNVS